MSANAGSAGHTALGMVWNRLRLQIELNHNFQKQKFCTRCLWMQSAENVDAKLALVGPKEEENPSRAVHVLFS
jgi:hypothetical protein